MRPVVRPILPLFLLAVASCASGPREIDRIAPGTPGYRMLPGRVSLPRGKYTPTNCGPETLCAALNYIGIPVSIADVEHEIYLDSIRGSVPTNLIAYARRKGAKATLAARGTVWKLEEHVQSGFPVLIEVTSGGLYHYYLVVGLNKDVRVVVCAFYEDRQHLLDFDQLDELWSPTGWRFITFEVTSAEKLVADGNDCLEGGRYELAERLFQDALKLRPGYAPALKGLGRVRIHDDRRPEARDLLERALQEMPGDPGLLNDLADTILSLKGDAARAARLAEEAVAAQLRLLRDLQEELAQAPPGTRDRVRDDVDNARRELFYYYGTLGQAYEATGQGEKSAEARERSFEYAPAEEPDSIARRHVETALLLRTMGARERSADHLRKGREKAKDAELLRRIDRVILEGSEAERR